MDINQIIEEINKELESEFNIENLYNKCVKYLNFEDIFSVENIYVSAKRCAVGFKNRNDTRRFFRAPWLNSFKLHEKIMNGRFIPKYYKTKIIIERGKQREIKPPVFESKVVQKLICDWIIRPLLEPEMIKTSYASITGRGTAKMYEDILRGLNANIKNKNAYIVMTDFKSYFPSIDLKILKNMLEERIKDKKIVNLIMKFSNNTKGLSLGNELSQIPASFFPTTLDKLIKEKLSTSQYFRYMDDTLFITSSKEETIKIIEIFTNKSKELNLTLKPPKVIKIRNYFIFCKERFLLDKTSNKYFVLCNKQFAIREKRKLRFFKRRLDKGEMSMEKIFIQYKSFRNSLKNHFDCIKVINKLDRYFENLFGEGCLKGRLI